MSPAVARRPGYEIVPYDPALKGRITQLQRHLWRGDPALNAAYFEWKYERNPYLGEPLAYVALDGAQAVGMRGVFGSKWEAGQPTESFVVPAADDLVLDPEHRSRGLVSRIMQTALADLDRRGFAHTFSLSPGPATLAASLASGWHAVGPLQLVRRAAPPGPARRGFLAAVRAMRPPARMVARLEEVGVRRSWGFKGLDRPRASTSADRRVQLSVSPVPRIEAMTELIQALGHDGRLRHVRDETYLEWRFRNPLHEYRFVYLDGDRLEGYVVLQRYRLSPRRGVNVVDWEATGPDAHRRLLRAVIEWGRFARLSTWLSALPAESARLLTPAGFVSVRGGHLARHLPSILVRTVNDDLPGADPTLAGRRLRDLGSWDLRMAYTMAG